MRRRGEQAFDAFFMAHYGERWVRLKAALIEPGLKVARFNQFYALDPTAVDWRPSVGEPVASVAQTYQWLEECHLDEWPSGLLPVYRMDPASVVAARALGVQPGERVLDICAAPGGKTLVLLEGLLLEEENGGIKLATSSGELVANELSAKRRHRLMTVIKRYVPRDLRSRVEIRGWDGMRFGLREVEQYDRILLDAPCSGERGLLQKPAELAQWTEKRSRGFAIRQYALLAAAFAALKPGVTLIYSTCSISPHENDGVIQKLISKRKRLKGDFEVEQIESQGLGERTDYGTHFLPDLMPGWGPIYFCRIKKYEAS